MNLEVIFVDLVIATGLVSASPIQNITTTSPTHHVDAAAVNATNNKTQQPLFNQCWMDKVSVHYDGLPACIEKCYRETGDQHPRFRMSSMTLGEFCTGSIQKYVREWAFNQYWACYETTCKNEEKQAAWIKRLCGHDYGLSPYDSPGMVGHKMDYYMGKHPRQI